MKTIRHLIAAVFALLACHVFADANPVFYIPTTCAPPTVPTPGHPGYGSANPLPNGAYYDPGSGLWFIPDSMWNPDENSSTRDIEITSTLNDLMNPPPVRPDWAIFDQESDGTYYWGGGYYNGHYYGSGYYLANEIW